MTKPIIKSTFFVLSYPRPIFDIKVSHFQKYLVGTIAFLFPISPFRSFSYLVSLSAFLEFWELAFI